ncbi:hypothetical protein BD289DRAFT_12272 [Coniella lustricola]|uniref:Uncharacterized protein n=1 Tax=Coniella lustricola TaxID=2025994 RepID=A0A2T3A4B0_9PEZI|nr:hypothetical protein BD289DRAFT_12272 [Coniella lustricola]
MPMSLPFNSLFCSLSVASHHLSTASSAFISNVVTDLGHISRTQGPAGQLKASVRACKTCVAAAACLGICRPVLGADHDSLLHLWFFKSLRAVVRPLGLHGGHRYCFSVQFSTNLNSTAVFDDSVQQPLGAYTQLFASQMHPAETPQPLQHRFVVCSTTPPLITPP